MGFIMEKEKELKDLRKKNKKLEIDIERLKLWIRGKLRLPPGSVYTIYDIRIEAKKCSGKIPSYGSKI